MSDDKLWKAFSIYIRLRDADDDGYCYCITCGRPAPWRQMDCGHGLGRQHKAIKYDEKNNHAQCGKCNLDGGRQDVYKDVVNKKYGPQTWSLLEIKSRGTDKKSQFEIDALEKHYKAEAKRLAIKKGLTI